MNNRMIRAIVITSVLFLLTGIIIGGIFLIFHLTRAWPQAVSIIAVLIPFFFLMVAATYISYD